MADTSTDLVTGGNVAPKRQNTSTQKAMRIEHLEGKGEGARQVNFLFETAKEAGLKTSGVYTYADRWWGTSLYMLNFRFEGEAGLVDATSAKFEQIWRKYSKHFD